MLGWMIVIVLLLLILLLPVGIDQLHTRYAVPSAYRPYMKILSRRLK